MLPGANDSRHEDEHDRSPDKEPSIRRDEEAGEVLQLVDLPVEVGDRGSDAVTGINSQRIPSAEHVVIPSPEHDKAETGRHTKRDHDLRLFSAPGQTDADHCCCESKVRTRPHADPE